MRRVVVTGLGAVTPLADGVQPTWEALIQGRSGIRKIKGIDVSDLPAQIAGQVPDQEDNAAYPFEADRYIPPKDQRKVDRFIIYALAASHQALSDAGWAPEKEEDMFRSGVLIGSGIGGLPKIYETSSLLDQQGPKRVSPFFIPASLINLASGQVAIRHKLKGPNHAVVTACAAGSHAIGDAARLIQMGDADVMVAGGAEAAVSRIGIAGFAAARALSISYNETPEKASRPWDKDREGFVMSEGAGIVVLEELEHAQRRGAKIYGELIGYGLSGDAHHITAPAEDGDGAYRAMKVAFTKAQISTQDIGYINAHGTSTPLGDDIELKAVRRLLGEDAKKVAMSSTKSSLGHLLGAAGGVEAVITLKVLNEGILPPTLNLENPPEDNCIDLVPHKAKEKKVKIAISNSFGFGGTNASLIFKAFER